MGIKTALSAELRSHAKFDYKYSGFSSPQGVSPKTTVLCIFYFPPARYSDEYDLDIHHYKQDHHKRIRPDWVLIEIYLSEPGHTCVSYLYPDNHAVGNI